MLFRFFLFFLFGLFNFVFAVTIPLNQTSADTLLRQQKQNILSENRSLLKSSAVKIPKFKSNLFKKHQHLKFILHKVNLSGDKNISNLDLESIFIPFYGKNISLSKLQALVEQATDKMLKEGFILSHAYLPEQTIDKGIVKINIVQGFIKNYQVIGNINEANKTLLNQYIAPVIQAKVFNSKQLERAILSINMLPGLSIKSVLSPDKKTPDAAVLTLFTNQATYNLLIKTDNLANRLQGREQVFIGASSYNNFIKGETSAWVGHSLTSRSARSLSISHKRFLNNDNGLLSFLFNISDSVPDYSTIGMPSLDDQGLAKEFSVKYSYPVYLTRNLSNTVFAAFTVHDSDMENLNTNTLTFTDKVRSIKLGNMLKFNDINQGNNTFLTTLTQGINGLKANNDNPSRIDGVLNFTKFNLLFSRFQPLFYKINWNLTAMGQYSLDPLLVSEEFNLGGHGYDFGEIAGDRGYSVYNEFNYNLTPGLFDLQLYTFHYVGTAFNINSISQLRRESLASAGLGSRILFNKNISADIYIAKPLTRAIALEGNKDLRLFFSLNFNLKG
jgi:hemolysin activation/secretion protein